MSDNGKINGAEHYWPCGRKATHTILARPGPGIRYVCKMHAKVNDRLAAKLKYVKPAVPL